MRRGFTRGALGHLLCVYSLLCMCLYTCDMYSACHVAITLRKLYMLYTFHVTFSPSGEAHPLLPTCQPPLTVLAAPGPGWGPCSLLSWDSRTCPDLTSPQARSTLHQEAVHESATLSSFKSCFQHELLLGSSGALLSPVLQERTS